MERSFCEDVKLEHGLPWKTQDGRDIRVMEYPPRRAVNRKWNHPKERTMLKSTKLQGVGNLKNITISDMTI